MGVSLSPAAMAQAAEDTAAFRQQASPDLLNQMTPNQAQALAANDQARQVAYAVTNEIGPFGKPIPAEVLRRSDTLYSNVTIPADGTAIPNVVPFWTAVSPDGITQSQEIVQSRITAQVDFEIRSVSIQARLNLGDENIDFLMRSSVFEINSMDQNIFRRQMASGMIRNHAQFATALSNFAAPTEVTLVTGVDPRGVDLDPTQYILWERNQTLNMILRFIAGAILPVPLGAAGTNTDLILTLWGRKQTKQKA